jgi:hypothetical protein
MYPTHDKCLTHLILLNLMMIIFGEV